MERSVYEEERWHFYPSNSDTLYLFVTTDVTRKSNHMNLRPDPILELDKNQVEFEPNRYFHRKAE